MKHNLDLGQHFMHDEVYLQLIVSQAAITPLDIVLEVGSGQGALTKHILKTNPKELICVEYDSRLGKPDGLVRFVEGDILEEIDSFKFNKLVANLPYHISEPLFAKLSLLQPERIVVVVGKSFADKLFSESIIGLVIASVYDVREITTIQPQAFSPPPKTLSSLVVLTKKKQTFADEIIALFYAFSRSKVKNYLLHATELLFSKKVLKAKLGALPAVLQGKSLYELSTKEFLEVHTFINNVLFDKAK